jgi:hypothetical protein
MLRNHSRGANRKLADVAAAVVAGHRLLPKVPQPLPAPLTARSRAVMARKDRVQPVVTEHWERLLERSFRIPRAVGCRSPDAPADFRLHAKGAARVPT